MVPDNRGKKYKTHDQEMIKRLASTMCSYEEIGFIIGMTGAGVKKRFSKAIDEGRAKGKASLRQAQFEKALAGDTRMQIWLGMKRKNNETVHTTKNSSTGSGEI